MLSDQEVRELLQMPKISSSSHVNMEIPRTELKLFAQDDAKVIFGLSIQPTQQVVKLTCHHMYSKEYIGISRLDIGGSHRNHKSLTNHVPQFLHPYAGKQFINEPHIHIYVENYNLDWAMPLVDYGFPVMDFNDRNNFSEIVRSFARIITLTTPLNFRHDSTFLQGST